MVGINLLNKNLISCEAVFEQSFNRIKVVQTYKIIPWSSYAGGEE